MDFFVVQQQPQLETGNRGNGAKLDNFPFVIAQLPVQRFGLRQSIKIG